MLLSVYKYRDLSVWIAYPVAILLVALAVSLNMGLRMIVERPITSPFFLGATVIATWIGGIRVGLLASVLCGFAIDFFFFPPIYSFAVNREELVRFVLFVGQSGLLCVIIEQAKKTTGEIRRSREELRELTKHQQTVRESEQKRIALELHDELGQALTGLKMDAHFLSEHIGSMEPATERDRVLDDVKKLSKRIDNTLVSIRRITSELRPSILDDFGLVAASEWQAKEFERTTSIKCEFSSNVDELDLGSESNTAVFRIVQEALTNVARHAAASSVTIVLSRLPELVKVSVVDDGKGIGIDNQISAQTLGLLGMRERSHLIGGELNISERPSGGTSIELSIPITTRTA